MRRVVILLSVTLALTFALPAMVGSAFADQVYLTFNNAYGHTLDVYTPNQGNADTQTAPYEFTISGTPTGVPDGKINNSSIPNATYDGFCIQFNQDIFNGANGQFNVISLAQDLPDLPGSSTTVNYRAEDILALIKDYTNPPLSGDPTNLGRTATVAKDALTIAIWDVLAATGNNSSGYLSVVPGTSSSDHQIGVNFDDTTLNDNSNTTTGAVALANSWLKQLHFGTSPALSDQYSSSSVVAFASPTLQDQSVVISFAYPFVSTPEPYSLVSLVGMGILGMTIGGCAFMVRRRRAA
jgi:hypothetical protein